MISKAVSVDILRYLQEDQGLSVNAIAASMDTTVDHIKKVISKKELFSENDINAYLKSSKLHFWEFAIQAIKPEHMTQKSRDRIHLCKEISDHIKKKKY